MKEVDPIIIAVAKQYNFSIKTVDYGHGAGEFIQIEDSTGSGFNADHFYWTSMDGTVESFFDEVMSYFKECGCSSFRY